MSPESQGVEEASRLPRMSLPCGPAGSSIGQALFREPDEAFLRHLDVHGYAVLQNILGSPAERQRFLDAFWAALTAVVPSQNPSRRETWRFPKGFRGIVTSYGLPQADFAWMVRLSPRIHQAFSRIFGTEDLVASLDAVIAEEGIAKRPLRPWLHKDQRPDHPLLSVQAVYSFFESGPCDAGTCVVPGTHRITFDWEHGAHRDFLKAPSDCDLRPDKLYVPADSAVFFNSRLVHASTCGRVARADDPVTGLPRPSRLGTAVALAPRARRSAATRLRKERAYFGGQCSSHWPCDRFQVKPPPQIFQRLEGARPLASPPAVPARLALL